MNAPVDPRIIIGQNSVTLDNQDYEVIPSISVSASRAISDMYIRLGKPEDPFSDAGEKMMHVIVSVWEDLYPRQRVEWLEARKEYKNSELSIKEQVKGQTGRSLASIPLPIYRLMRKVFPDFKMSAREDFLRLVKKYPIFRMANKA